MDDPGTTIKILNWLKDNPSFIGLSVSMFFNWKMLKWIERKEDIITKLYSANNENMAAIKTMLSLIGK